MHVSRTLTLSLAVVALGGLAACGGGGGSTSAAGATGSGGTGSSGGTGGSSIPPNTVDLQFVDYHIHGGYYSSSPITFHFIPKNSNTANISVDIDWAVRDANGNTIQSGTLPNMPAGAQQDVIFDYANNQPGTNPYYIILDPDNKIPETDKSNNIAEVIAFGNNPYPSLANPGPNELIWGDAHIHHFPPNGLAFHAVIENIGTSSTTVSNIPFQVTREDGTVVFKGVIPELGPGIQAADDAAPIQSWTETPGEHTYTWVIDPDHTIPGNDPGNDTIQDMVVIPSNGSG